MNRGTVAISYIHPEYVTAHFHLSMLALYVHDMQNDRRIVGGGGHVPVGSGANISNARNSAVALMLDSTPAEWFLSIDTDMQFPPYAVDRLLAVADPAERPIVGGLCFGPWRAEGDSYFPTLYWFTGDDRVVARAIDYPENELVQVGATGAAFLMIHRTVLERMREAFPPPWHWFHEQLLGPTPVGEDVTFCLKARELGFPIYVDTGLKIGHVKETVIDEAAFRRYRNRIAEPKFAIVGTGRSGTGYAANLLTALQIRCGHEEWWNPYGTQSPDLVGDASWLAVPEIAAGDYDGIVFAQHRHPLKVIQSLANGEIAQAWSKPYLEWKLQNVPNGPEVYAEDPLAFWVDFVATWLQAIDTIDLAHEWKIEDLDADELELVVAELAQVGIPEAAAVDPEWIPKVVDLAPTNYNEHGPKPALSWSDLPDRPAKTWLEEVYAPRWGYDLDPAETFEPKPPKKART